MAAPLEDTTHEEQRAVIRFLAAEGVKPSEVYRECLPSMGSNCLNQRNVNGWRDLKKGVQVPKMSPGMEGLQT